MIELRSTMVTALATVLLPLTAETVPFALSALSKHVVGENILPQKHVDRHADRISQTMSGSASSP